MTYFYEKLRLGTPLTLRCFELSIELVSPEEVVF